MVMRHIRVQNDDETLRRLLFLNHGHRGPALYGDDGELQCRACGLDYKRDALPKIEGTLLWLCLGGPRNEGTTPGDGKCPNPACRQPIINHRTYAANIPTESGYRDAPCPVDVAALVAIAIEMIFPLTGDPFSRGKLGMLADWCDMLDAKRESPWQDNNGVQQDLRAWADRLTEALSHA